jgi:ribosomal protein S27AE
VEVVIDPVKAAERKARREEIDRLQIPNNRCVKCGKMFYAWFHGQGMVCGECNTSNKDENNDNKQQ